MKRIIFFIVCIVLLTSCNSEEPKPVAFPTDSISFSTHYISMVPGEERVLHVDFYTTQPYSWSTTDSIVTKVSPDGILTAISDGAASVVVRCSDWTTATDTAFVQVKAVPIHCWLPKTYMNFKADKDEVINALASMGYELLSGDTVGFKTVNSYTVYNFSLDQGQQFHCTKIEQQVYGWADSITTDLMDNYTCVDSIKKDLGLTYYFITESNNEKVRVIAEYVPACRGRNDSSCYYVTYYPLPH